MNHPTPPPLPGAAAASTPAWTLGDQPAPVGPPATAPAGPPTGPNFTKAGQPIAAPVGPPIGAAAPPATPTFIGTTGYDGPPAPPRYALAALAIAGLAGLLVSGNTPGLALALVAVAIIAATQLLETPRNAFSWACLAGAGALAVVPALRDSGWVGTLSLLGAMSLTAIAVSTPATWRELGVAAFGWIGQLVPAPVRVLSRQGKQAAGVRWSQCAPILRGVLLASVLVVIFGALFAAADARFAEIADDLLAIDLSLDAVAERAWVFVLVLACAGALWLTAATRKERPAREAQTKLGATEWLIALGALAALFAGFVVLQLDVLFGGDSVVQLTAGLTYAEYARQGFGQMTLAAILTLGVVAAAVRYGPRENLGVRLLCGALCLLTLVILASAMHRLGLYQDAYGSTRLRFSMTALMTWLGAVLLAVVIAGAAGRTDQLPRLLVLISAAFAIGTVTVNPDHRIAERNVQRFADTGKVDAAFLTTLSADAVPAIREAKAPWANCVQATFSERLGNGDPLPSWNAGRARGRAALDPAAVEAGIGLTESRYLGGDLTCTSP